MNRLRSLCIPRVRLPAARGLALPVLLAVFTIFPAGADTVYRWTDADGRVQFSDRPPPTTSQPAAEVELPEAQVTTGVGEERTAARQRLLDVIERERTEQRVAQERAEADAAKLEKRCSRARRRLAQLDSGRRLYVAGEGDERRYLSEAERAAERQRIVAGLRKDCGGP